MKSFQRKELCWQPLSPNYATSSSIQATLYFGRAIYINMPKSKRNLGLSSKVFVMSGCTSKNNTSLNCTEVQEWSLSDMTVRKVEPLVPSRTSYSAFHQLKDRFIYVLGGNHVANHPLNDVQRLDIYSKRWQKLPSMCEPRANASSTIPDGSDYLYAFGGYNNNYNSSTVVNNIERLCVTNVESQKW